MPNLSKEAFVTLAAKARAQSASATLAIPLSLRLLSDQLTPVLAYRRLVVNDQREAPSFLLESVEGGERQGRYSILGAQPDVEVIAFGAHTTIRTSGPQRSSPSDQPPFDTLRAMFENVRLLPAPSLPACVLAGWFGY